MSFDLTQVVLILLSPVGPVSLGPGFSVSEGLSRPVGHVGPWHRTDACGLVKSIFSSLVYVTVMKDEVVGLNLGTGWLGLEGSIYVAGT